MWMDPSGMARVKRSSLTGSRNGHRPKRRFRQFGAVFTLIENQRYIRPMPLATVPGRADDDDLRVACSACHDIWTFAGTKLCSQK